MAVDKKYINTESEAKSIYILDRASQGASFQQIASELNMTVAAVQARYRKEAKLQLSKMANVVAEVKLLQTQQLSYIYNQAIMSWQLSSDTDPETGNPRKEGDPKFLDTAMKSLKDVRTIWNADRQLDITPESIEFSPGEEAERLGGNINQVQDVLQVLQDIKLLPADFDMEQLGEHLVPVEHKGELDLPEEIL